MSKVIEEIKRERQKQIDKGFNAAHDDRHVQHELSTTAVQLITGWDDKWGLSEKHRGNARRKMIIAISLLVAEVERRDRDTRLPPEIA